MANSSDTEVENLHTLFKEGLDLYNTINSSEESTSSPNYLNQVKKAISIFENVTKFVSLASIFSRNEEIEELPTEHIKFLLLPSFLGFLTLKLSSNERKEVIDIAEIYFKDFLERCNDYNLLNDDKNKKEGGIDQRKLRTEIEQLVDDANDRKAKIERYRQRKDLKVKLELLGSDVNGEDDENKRDYYSTFIKLSIIEATDELASIRNERPILRHLEKMKKEGATATTVKSKPPVTAKLNPVIITKDEIQKAVYGAGYPSLPTMTVQEFYDKRVQDGVFPDPTAANSRAKKSPNDMSMHEAALAGFSPEFRDDLDDENKEKMAENDDEDYLRNARRTDDFKDEHRRGWGNRANRS